MGDRIALIGMPGAGKTCIARRIADLSGLLCIDTDERIERQTGMPISSLFALRGEAYFRALETEALLWALGQSSAVIATGGGAVVSPGNRAALRDGARVFWIQRALHLLPSAGRPLSIDLPALHSAREPLYRAASHQSILNDGAIDQAARRVLSLCQSIGQK